MEYNRNPVQQSQYPVNNEMEYNRNPVQQSQRYPVNRNEMEYNRNPVQQSQYPVNRNEMEYNRNPVQNNAAFNAPNNWHEGRMESYNSKMRAETTPVSITVLYVVKSLLAHH